MNEHNKNEIGWELTPELEMALTSALAEQARSLLLNAGIRNLRINPEGQICGEAKSQGGYPRYGYLDGINLKVVKDNAGKERIMITAESERWEDGPAGKVI